MKYKIVFLSVLLSLFVAKARAETVDKIVAKVGSEVIMLSDVTQALTEQRHYFLEKLGKAKGEAEFVQFKAHVLEEMILQKVLTLEIKRESIKATDAEVDQELKSRLTQYGLSETQLVANLAKEGMGLAAYKNSIRQELERQQFLQKKIIPNINMSDYDLQKEYESNLSQYQVYTKLHFIEVFLTPEKFPSQDELTKTAQDIERKLRAGQNVAVQIKQYSSGAFAATGGDSGLVSAKDLRGEIQAVLSKMKIGETSPLMPIAGGVFIFKLIAKADPQPMPLAQVMPQVRAQYGDRLVNEELKKYLMSVKEQTYVEIMRL